MYHTLERAEKVSVQDVARVAASCFQEDRRTVATLFPEDAQAAEAEAP
jgi:predicted Zn-dependent peptidase